MTVEVTFRGGIELTMEVSDKYKVLSEMMYSDKRFTDRHYDNQYCDLVNQCIEEIYNNYKTNFLIFSNFFSGTILSTNKGKLSSSKYLISLIFWK